jgi:hypothetical protein
MKITKSQLKQIIKEELNAAMEGRLDPEVFDQAASSNPFLNLPKASDKEAFDYFVDYVTHPLNGLSTGYHDQKKAYDDLIEWMKQYPNVFKDYLEDRKDVYDLISKGQVEARAEEWKEANPGKKLSKMEPPRLKGQAVPHFG